jgi:hypothetical protein
LKSEKNVGWAINLKLIFRLPEHQQNSYRRGWGVTLSLIFVLILTLVAPIEILGPKISMVAPFRKIAQNGAQLKFRLFSRESSSYMYVLGVAHAKWPSTYVCI